jgi:hypothetical protein
MILINSKFSYSGHLIQRIESFKILMSCFPILQLHRIYNKRLVLLETFLCAYGNYGMYSIPIESCCVLFYGATKRLLRPIPAFFIPVGFYMSWHNFFLRFSCYYSFEKFSESNRPRWSSTGVRPRTEIPMSPLLCLSTGLLWYSYHNHDIPRACNSGTTRSRTSNSIVRDTCTSDTSLCGSPYRRKY